MIMLFVSPYFFPRNECPFYSVNISTEFPRWILQIGYCGARWKKKKTDGEDGVKVLGSVSYS